MGMHPVQQLRYSVWASHNPSSCLCKGSGWLLSDYDTWHECGFHGGTPHPENDLEGSFDWEAHLTKIYRKAFLFFREQSGLSPKEFKKLVVERAPEQTPRGFVDAAEEIVLDLLG